MIPDDYRTFDRALRRVCGAFRLKLRGEEMAELTQTYFRVLELHPLAAVLDAGKRLIATSRRFPLAADWLTAIESPTHATAPAADVRHMGATELAEYEAAERERFNGPACWCIDCRAAHVEDRPLRFVPTMLTPEVYETAYHPHKQRMQIAGHWAHGPELAAWYAARAECMAHAKRIPRFAALARILVRADRGEREPGEDG
jgi:hypothetical protein